MLSPLLRRALAAAKPPSREEELALIRRAQAGDVGARNALVVRHLRWINALARRRLGPADEDDLVAVGCEAMTIAIARFDPERGVRLTTYARAWLRQRLSRYAAGERQAWALSLDAAGDELDAPTLHDRVDDKDAATVDELAEVPHMRRRLAATLPRLRPRDRRLLEARARGATLDVLAAEIGLTRQGASAAEHAAIARAADAIATRVA